MVVIFTRRLRNSLLTKIFLIKNSKKKDYERDMTGLRSKAPMDGTKKTPCIAGELSDMQSKVLHIKVHRDCCDTIKRDIKEILKKPSFKKITTTGEI